MTLDAFSRWLETLEETKRDSEAMIEALQTDPRLMLQSPTSFAIIPKLRGKN